MSAPLLNHQAKYRHVADALREYLRTHQKEDKLPPLRTLMKQFEVSQHTITAALEILEGEELISRRQGSGIYVNRTVRPRTVCFCRSQDGNPGYDSAEDALRKACERRGWKFLVDPYDPLQASIFVDDSVADAFILLPGLVTFKSPLLGRLAKEGLPTVIFGRDTSSAGLDFVTGADAMAIRELVMGLVKLGHQRIAYLNCEPAFYEVKSRVDTFLDLCHLIGVEHYPVLDVGAEYGHDSIARSEAYLREYLASLGGGPLPFTAMITGSMAGSIPAPRVFHDAGYEIPRDVSLCCLGGDPRAKYALPSISNTAPHHTELAEAAMNIIEKRLAGDPSPLLFENIVYPVIWRESVAPPAA